jgi:hypothetical protein
MADGETPMNIQQVLVHQLHVNIDIQVAVHHSITVLLLPT